MEQKVTYTALPSIDLDEQGRSTPSSDTSGTSRAITTAFLLSVVINIVFFSHSFVQTKTSNECKPNFSGLVFDTEVEYSPKTGYSSSNHTERERLWEQLDTSPIVIALSDHFAREQDLDIAPVRFPWDEEKGLYHVKVFHQIHCLKNIHRAFTELDSKNQTSIAPSHVYHCLDALLQDVKCAGDDTPMPTYEHKHHIGNGQKMVCRNFEQLVGWAQHPQRSACFRMLTDYGSVPNSLEQFAFCPPGSRYEDVQRAYFEKFGHKDPWGKS